MSDEDTHFDEGDRYILVDAGGGTVDIICHEVLDDFGVKEIYYPSGGKWGSCYIDDQYIKLLKSIFGTRWINEFKKKSPESYVELINYFQNSKETFYAKSNVKRRGNINGNQNDLDDDHQYHNVRLPAGFLSFAEDKLESLNDATGADQDLADMVNEHCSGKSKMKLDEEYLEMSNLVWKYLFDHVIDPAIEHIEYLLSQSKMNECKYLCLVGGLACSKYYQYRMRKHLELNQNID